jgi:hypothetical protein
MGQRQQQPTRHGAAQTAAQAGLAGGQPGMVLVKGLQQGQAFFQPGNPVPALQRRVVGGEGLYGRHGGLKVGAGRGG